MNNSSFHSSFRLNSTSFNSNEELLDYAKRISTITHQFLTDWFSDNDSIEVTTSGSTGKPKPIQLKKEHMRNSAIATGTCFAMLENTKALCCLPVEFIAGKMMLVRALTLGWNLDVVAPSSSPLEKNQTQYDFVAMVPMQVQNSIEQLHQIDTLIIGGGVVSESLLKQLQEMSVKAHATYGMTETITHIAIKQLNHIPNVISSGVEKTHEITSQKDFARKDGYYQILPNVTISQDTRGCLVINAPKLSDELVVTNDVVALISENTFEWKGRYDNVINSGGVKLHPEGIERKLSAMLSQRFFVAGIPDEQLGEKLVLIVEGDNVISTEVEKSIKNSPNLTKYEIPKEIYFIDQFVETKTKKIQRQETLDMLLKNKNQTL